VSSSHPAAAGLQAPLAELLLDYGAAFDDAVLTALLFGFADTARALVKRGAPLDQLPTVAALGLIEETSRLLPNADAESRHKALALAAQHGQTETVRLLLDAGEDPNRFNPKGFHAH